MRKAMSFRSTWYGMSPDVPLALLMTLTFEDRPGMTRLTLRHAGFPPGEMRDLTRAGGTNPWTSLRASLVRPCTKNNLEMAGNVL